MNERQRQMAQEQTGKAIPREQAQKERAEYLKKLERYKKVPKGSGEIKTAEADAHALDEACEKKQNKN